MRGRFQGGLCRVLRAVEKWSESTGDSSQAVAVKALADRLEAAGSDLDVCAANCHALAMTLRAQTGVDSVPSASVQAGVRLSKALGSPVVLTRTTIEQLVGKTLRLEYIEGANAIVQVNGEYWGTPLDRVLVLEDPADANPESATQAGGNPAIATPPAFTFALRQGELSNTIQFLAMTARNGVLTVTAASSKARGYLTLESRRVTHAEFGAFQDIDAVARMMSLEASEAVFHDGLPTARATMHMSTDQLLIEAAVRADELAQ